MKGQGNLSFSYFKGLYMHLKYFEQMHLMAVSFHFLGTT